jgi:hypothetical protein
MAICGKFKSILRNGIVIAISMGLSVLFIYIDYLAQNCKYPFFDNLMVYSLTEYFAPKDKTPLSFYNDSVVCVNVAHDKALTTYTDKKGRYLGNDYITDRDSLLKFLSIANKSQYKYIFLDVRFSKRHKTETDSALFALLCSMKNIVVSNHANYGDYELADERLKPITGMADYGITLTTGFSRYEFLQDDEPSVALKMYRDIDHGDIVRHGNFYRDKATNRVCLNTPFIPMPRLESNIYEDDGRYRNRYPYLGTKWLSLPEDVVIDSLRGKYVLIGDFDEDLHGTYIGDVPGPMLSFISYKFIKDGKHKYPILLFWIMFVWYTVIFTSILCNAFHNFSINVIAKLRKATSGIIGSLSKFIVVDIVILVIKWIYKYIFWSFIISLLYKLFDIAFITIIPSFAILIVSNLASLVQKHLKKK